MNNAALWYAGLIKPPFAPPAWVFAPVWSALYVLIAISFGYVFYQTATHRWPRSIAIPFLLNLLANLLFSPIQFGLQNNVLAMIDIVIVLLTIPWMMRVVWGRARWIGWMQVPYLVWVGFATTVEVGVVWLNG